MKNRIISMIGLALLAANTVYGTVAINFNADMLRNSLGSPVSTTSLALLVADTSGAGFGGILNASALINQYSTITSTTTGSNLMVLWRSDFSAFGTNGIVSFAATPLTLQGSWVAGDKLAIVWFPTLTLANTSLAGGTSYGLITNSNWVTPTNGGTTPIPYQVISTTNNGAFTSNANTSNLTNAQTNATFTVVPEPGSLSLLLLGGCGLFAARRYLKRKA